MHTRVNKAWLGWKFTILFYERHMPIHLKWKVYKTMVHSAALYNAECWSVTNMSSILYMPWRCTYFIDFTCFSPWHVSNDNSKANIRESVEEVPTVAGPCSMNSTHITAYITSHFNIDSKWLHERLKQRWKDIINAGMKNAKLDPNAVLERT